MPTKSQQESVRLFKNPFMEALTHVHPITPLVMWGPVVAFLIYRAWYVKQLALPLMVTWFVIGLVVWTLTEYVLHRFAFHFDSENRAIKYIVFLFHGIHHDYPEDATRLVMPPAPGIILMSLIFAFFSIFVPSNRIEIFMASFIIGYLCYDYIHYGTHHWPMKSKIGRYLRKYHLQHHYSCPDGKFGVSNPLWDYVFRTVESKLKNKNA